MNNPPTKIEYHRLVASSKHNNLQPKNKKEIESVIDIIVLQKWIHFDKIQPNS